MIRHETKRPPEFAYPIDEWRMLEKRFYPKILPQTETIFSIGNGYLGMRGNSEEGRPAHQSGTFVNGFYESWPIVYGEDAYGFAKTGQTMLNVPDGRIMKLYVDDEPLYLPTADLLSFERVLDMRAGTLDRSLVWETAVGKIIEVKSRRLVSFPHRHLAAISFEVTVRNAKAPVVISSELVNDANNMTSSGDPRKARGFQGAPLIQMEQEKEGMRVMLGYRTRQSGMTLACGVDHELQTECEHEVKTGFPDDRGRVDFRVSAEPGQPIRITKYITYHTSRGRPPVELCARAHRTLDRAANEGFEALLAGQREYLDDFWHRSDILIEIDPTMVKRRKGEIQQAIRWNLFQILQASGRAEGVGVPAKGLTGQAYEGHYFWDTEMYVLPFLVYTAPRIARNLLRFRHSMLDKARERAAQLHHRGALFPWRTINGEEASAYYAAGSAQFHINADIMFALKKYVQATGDTEFLYDEGAEMLVETARMWLDHGFYSERKDGKFCIHAVTGPDEYTTVVNNNTFTNLMARENLRYAATTAETMRSEQPERFNSLVHRTNLEESEIDEWRRAAESMYVPYDQALGIHPQDDDFLQLEVWDFENTPPGKYPLLLHYHPLVIYRHQVIKQADVVLAMLLFGNEFSTETKKRNFDYYDPLTTGDSSLSACIQSIVATEIGDLTTALEYARYAVLMDLADVGANVSDGCHIASLGGTWMIFVYGFAGMRDYDGKLSFRPRLPSACKRLEFPLTVHGQELEVLLDTDDASTTYLLRKGSGMTIQHYGRELELHPGQAITGKLEVVNMDQPGKPSGAGEAP